MTTMNSAENPTTCCSRSPAMQATRHRLRLELNSLSVTAVSRRRQLSMLSQQQLEPFDSCHGASIMAKHSQSVRSIEKPEASNTAAVFCAHCEGRLVDANAYDRVVRQEGSYHRSCFACCQCLRPLGNQQFFEIEGRKYCAYDYNVLFKTYCCCKCGLRLTDEASAVRAWGARWHVACLTCSVCDLSVTQATASCLRPGLCRGCDALQVPLPSPTSLVVKSLQFGKLQQYRMSTVEVAAVAAAGSDVEVHITVSKGWRSLRVRDLLRILCPCAVRPNTGQILDRY